MKQFSPNSMNKWINDQLYYDNDDSLISEFIKMNLAKKDPPTTTVSLQILESQQEIPGIDEKSTNK
jgi:hypothetical protein